MLCLELLDTLDSAEGVRLNQKILSSGSDANVPFVHVSHQHKKQSQSQQGVMAIPG